MRKGQASLTAIAVAGLRAAATEMGDGATCNPGDDVALRLVPRPAAHGIRALGAGGSLLHGSVRVASLGLLDHVALRTAKLDKALATAVTDGIDQIVVLGAGLDSRAHRELGLDNCRLYEVDHPDSQAYKLQRIAALPVCVAHLQHVPVAFGQQSLASALTAVGFDPRRRSFWIWEGVVMYLPEPAMRATLSELAALCCPGSRLALSYMVRDLIWLRGFGPLVRAAMWTLGEPLLGITSMSTMRETLEAHRLHVVEDTDTRDWARELGTARDASRLIAYERIALAERA